MSEDTVDEITSLLKEYTWLNGSCKPEVLYKGTYSVTNYNEAENVLTRIQAMIEKAEKVKQEIPASLQAAYYQLVYYPVVASANVRRNADIQRIYNRYYELGSTAANVYAKLVKKTIARDKDYKMNITITCPGWKKMEKHDEFSACRLCDMEFRRMVVSGGEIHCSGRRWCSDAGGT